MHWPELDADLGVIDEEEVKKYRGEVVSCAGLSNKESTKKAQGKFDETLSLLKNRLESGNFDGELIAKCKKFAEPAIENNGREYWVPLLEMSGKKFLRNFIDFLWSVIG